MKKDIKVLFAILALLFTLNVATSCRKDDKAKVSLPNITINQDGETPVMVTCDDILGGNYNCSFTVKINRPSNKYMICDISANESLVSAYNKAHGTNYEILPKNIYTISQATAIIMPGQTESNNLVVSFPGTLFGLKKDTKYLLPLTAELDETLAGDFEKGALTYYLAIDVDRELIYTVGLSMRNYSSAMYTTLNLPDNEVVAIDGNTHTFEARIFCYSWHNGTNYIGTWRGKDLNNNNENFSGCELRVTGTAGASNIGNRQCDLTLASQNKLVPSGKWQLLTITCDGTKTGQKTEVAYRYYLDGELIAEAAPTKRFGPTSSQRYQVGYTLTGIQFGHTSSGYYFDGLIGEIRMWKKCLSQEEIKANLRTVANPSKEDMYAYWKLDEGSGTTLKDSSGNNRDLNFASGANVVWGAELE